MRLAQITPPAFVNLKSPGIAGNGLMFYANLKWDGKRLLKPVHNLTYTRHGWSTVVDVTLEEMMSNAWVVCDKGAIPLDAPMF